MHFPIFVLLCDIAVLVALVMMAQSYNMKINTAVEFNQAMLNVSLCNSRGNWSASDQYNETDCVVYTGNNCIYVHHDGSVDARYRASMTPHGWPSMGPSYMQFDFVTCIRDTLPTVQAHQIPKYMHLHAVSEAVQQYCSKPDRQYELQDWLAMLFPLRDPNYMCQVELMSTLAIRNERGIFRTPEKDPALDEVNLMVVQLLMGAEECVDAIDDFHTSSSILFSAFSVRLVLFALAFMLYAYALVTGSKRLKTPLPGWMVLLHMLLVAILFISCVQYLFGVPQLKFERYIGRSCRSDFLLFVIMVFAIISTAVIFVLAVQMIIAASTIALDSAFTPPQSTPSVVTTSQSTPDSTMAIASKKKQGTKDKNKDKLKKNK